MSGALGVDAPSKTTICRWYNEFKRGRKSCEDDPRSGRPSTSVTDENIDAVRELVKDNRRITYKEIKATLGISSSAVRTILHERLGFRKVCSRWVPHRLTPEQMEARVCWCKKMLAEYGSSNCKRVWNFVTGDETWIYFYDPLTKQESTVWVARNELPPTKVVREKSSFKRMFAIFFMKTGIVASVMLPAKTTVTAYWYRRRCLPKVLSGCCKRRPKTALRGLFLHHDNASAHTAKSTVNFLRKRRVKLLSHPPYSPDLVPCNFWLFPKVKKMLRGRRFQSEKELKTAVKIALNSISKREFRDCFKKWFERMQRCIDHQGRYFEKE
ncbi:MAG: mariner transposase [Bacteroidetes bacterium]|nr:MAG: mariner transposase [Bacteroidota bacterium]